MKAPVWAVAQQAKVVRLVDKKRLATEPAATVLVRVIYLGLFPFLGFLVAFIGFCDPDTCWHLALGKCITRAGSLPYVDPFSSNIHQFSFIAARLPLMQHEWLSDVAFYFLFSLAGLTGLLVATALLAACSLIIVPTYLMLKRHTPPGVVAVAVSLVVFASAFRLWVRPEAFSFLLMSLLIVVLYQSHRAPAAKRMRYLLFTLAIMIVWSNCHMVFLAGFALVVAFEILLAVDDLMAGRRPQYLQLALVPAAAFAGTLCTPWHLKLWQYVLILATSPVTLANKENGPIAIADLASPTGPPLLAIFLLGFYLFASRIARRKSQAAQYCAPALLCLGAAAAALMFRRLTPLALLVFLSGIGWLFEKIETIEKVEGSDEHLPDGKSRQWLFLHDKRLASGSILTTAVVCAFTASFVVRPQLPAASHLFKPPFRALAFLSKHRPAGRLFNDSKFGSMMTWDMIEPPDLFIDGRFSNYDRTIAGDYEKMRLARGDWRELLEKYKIDWVFLPPKTPLLSRLAITRDWHLFYADDAAVVLARQPQP